MGIHHEAVPTGHHFRSASPLTVVPLDDPIVVMSRKSSQVVSGSALRAPRSVWSEGFFSVEGCIGTSLAQGFPWRLMVTSSPSSNARIVRLTPALNSLVLYVDTIYACLVVWGRMTTNSIPEPQCLCSQQDDCINRDLRFAARDPSPGMGMKGSKDSGDDRNFSPTKAQVG